MWTNRYIGSRAKSLVLPLAFAAAFCGRAEAQTVSSFATGGSFSYDGLTFTISGCQSSGASNGAGCAAVEMTTVSQSRGSVAIEFLGNGTNSTYGSNALYVPQGTPGATNNATTSFVLTVTGSVSQITGLSAAVTSSAGTTMSEASLPFVVNASGCTITAGSAYPYAANGACEPYAGVSNPASVSVTPTASLSIDYNLSVNADASHADVLSTATTTFSKIPEPGSIGVMASGLLFLGFAHSKLRRAPRPARPSV